MESIGQVKRIYDLCVEEASNLEPALTYSEVLRSLGYEKDLLVTLSDMAWNYYLSRALIKVYQYYPILLSTNLQGARHQMNLAARRLKITK